ncbi:hypothetical protein KC328_g107 [Hortaea werneckii]|nr:hypothetical protein KC328_g107 [Hortaea werneckii]
MRKSCFVAGRHRFVSSSTDPRRAEARSKSEPIPYRLRTGNDLSIPFMSRLDGEPFLQQIKNSSEPKFCNSNGGFAVASACSHKNQPSHRVVLKRNCMPREFKDSDHPEAMMSTHVGNAHARYASEILRCSRGTSSGVGIVVNVREWTLSRMAAAAHGPTPALPRSRSAESGNMTLHLGESQTKHADHRLAQRRRCSRLPADAVRAYAGEDAVMELHEEEARRAFEADWVREEMLEAEGDLDSPHVEMVLGRRHAECTCQRWNRSHSVTASSSARDRERKDAIAKGFIADPNKARTLAEAITPVGTCRDMCAEFERVERTIQFDVKPEERGPDGSPDESRMVKKFRRAAAGLEEQLPSDLRPPPILKQTCDYLFNTLIAEAPSLGSVEHFVWDRTRAVRNDFSIQQLSKAEDLSLAIDCLERISSTMRNRNASSWIGLCCHSCSTTTTPAAVWTCQTKQNSELIASFSKSKIQSRTWKIACNHGRATSLWIIAAH